MLGIDTSTILLSVAIADESRDIICEYNEASKMQHGVYLLPVIDELLNHHQLTAKDINKIIVGIGPGSYTGLRIGVTAAKMWGISQNIQVFPVSSLALMAASVNQHESDLVIPVMDARRLSAYTAIYQYREGDLVTVSEDTHADWESWLSIQRSLLEMQNRVVIVGDKVEAFIEKAKELYPQIEWEIVSGEQALPHISRAFSMELTPFEDVHVLAPYYAQLTVAEREWIEKTENLNQDEALVDTTIY